MDPQPISFKTTQPTTPVLENVPVGGGVPAVAASAKAYPVTAVTTSAVELWGSEASKKSTEISQKITSLAKAGDMDELGRTMTNLIGAARGYDPSSWNKGIFGMVVRRTAAQIDAHVRSVNDNIKTITNQCTLQIRKFEERNGDLVKMDEENSHVYAMLGEDIIKGTEILAWAEQNVPTIDLNDALSSSKIQEWNDAISQGHKKIDDLKRHQVLCQLVAPQIVQLRDNGHQLVQKFHQAIDLTIPALQQQFALYVIQMEQTKAADLGKAVDDAFEAAVKKNAEALHQNSIAINTSMARSSVSVETLKHVSDELIATLDDVQKIRTDMKTRIDTEAPQIQALSQQLAARQAQGHV